MDNQLEIEYLNYVQILPIVENPSSLTAPPTATTNPAQLLTAKKSTSNLYFRLSVPGHKINARKPQTKELTLVKGLLRSVAMLEGCHPGEVGVVMGRGLHDWQRRGGVVQGRAGRVHRLRGTGRAEVIGLSIRSACSNKRKSS